MRLHPALAGIVLFGSVVNSPAALLLDFGPTSPSGASTTNSPFHVALGSTDSFWNVVGTADVGTLRFSDDTLATGLSLNLGASLTSGTVVSLNNQPDTSNALGTSINTGVFAGSSVGKDGIYEGTSGSGLSLSVGFQLTGLAAGTYEIYLVTRNTNTNQAYTMTSFAGAGIPGLDFDHSLGFESQTLEYPNQSGGVTASWIEGGNYTKLTVTLAEGEALNVAVSASGNQTRGFLNAAAIVPVPEPTAALSLLGSMGMLVGFRRPWRGR